MSDQFQTFDAYCKSVLRHAASKAHRGRKRASTRVIPFSGLTLGELEQLFYCDRYSVDSRTYHALDCEVEITEERLQEAIEQLTKEQRDVLLLSACFEHTDAEIATLLDIPRSTAQYRKNAAIRSVRTYLEGKQHDHDS